MYVVEVNRTRLSRVHSVINVPKVPLSQNRVLRGLSATEQGQPSVKHVLNAIIVKLERSNPKNVQLDTIVHQEPSVIMNIRVYLELFQVSLASNVPTNVPFALLESIVRVNIQQMHPRVIVHLAITVWVARTFLIRRTKQEDRVILAMFVLEDRQFLLQPMAF